jgi:hypothetical protein
VRVKPRILTIVQNLPLPFDRRVRLECHALVSAGYRFAVIQPCPGVYQRLTGGPKALDRTAEV